jgi:hypothetical protein
MTEVNLPPESAGGADPVDVRPETPEADAVEQAQSDAETPPDGTPLGVRHIPDDVPEADALEQSYEVDLTDDYRG